MPGISRHIDRFARQPGTVVVCLAAALASAIAAFVTMPAHGAIAELYGAPALQGPRLLYRIVPSIDPRLIVRDPPAPGQWLSARWTAGWRIEREAEYTFEVAADDRARVSIDGRTIVEPAAEPGIQHSTASVRLTPGIHLLVFDYEQVDGGMFLDTLVAKDDGTPEPLPVESMLAIGAVSEARTPGIARALWALMALCIAPAVWIALRQRRNFPARGASLVALAAILLLAGALRFDVLLGRVGAVDAPAWLRAIDTHGRLTLSRLAPVEFQWVRGTRMYQQGDPASYLLFAREMKSFYAAHPREPLFIGLTRSLLPVADWRDVAVGLASLLSSLVLIAAAYALGSILAPRWVGLLAALALAVEREAIAWNVEGWRDETFAAFFVIFACLAIQLRRRIDLRTAIATGVVVGGAMLTRVTSLTFIGAAAVALAIAHRGSWRQAGARRRALTSLAAATIVAVVLAGPYFLNCYRSFGNPLYAIDVHTGFYRDRQNAPAKQPLSATAYVRSRFAERPVRLTGIFVKGMTTYPFFNKWNGFDEWIPNAGRIAAALSLVGLILLASDAEGRMLLAVTAASLLPYAFTHDIQGGSEWRFTMHAYPVLLVAAALALGQAARAAPAWRAGPAAAARIVRARPKTIIAAAAVALIVAPLAYGWPYVELSEDAFSGNYAIFADRAHAMLFAGGWLEPVQRGNVISRSSEGRQGTMWVPIVHKRAHHLRLRLDPVETEQERPQELRVYVNRQHVSTLPIRFTEGRVGVYDVTVPADGLRRGLNRLDLLITPAGGDGQSDETPNGIRLWYIRLTTM